MLRCTILAVLCSIAVAAPARAQAPEGSGGGEGVDDGGSEGAQAPVDPTAPTVGASLDRTEAQVGDRLTLTVTAIARDAVADSVHLPDALSLGKFDLLDSSTTDQDLGNGKKSRRFVLQVATYELGEVEIPAIALSYRSPSGETRAATTRPIPVRVRPVVDDPKAAMQPLRPQRDVIVPDKRLTLGLIAAGVGLAVLLLGHLVARLTRRWRRRPKPVVVVPPRPPRDVAMERLREIRARGNFGVDGYRPAHFEIAEVVRGYLGGHFGFDALDRTTTELLDELARLDGRAPPLAGDQLQAIRRFLESCDLVKFAKASSSDAEVLQLLDDAEAMVRETQEAAVRAAEAATARAAQSAPLTDGSDGAKGSDGARGSDG